MVHVAPTGPLGFGGAPLGNMFDVVHEATAGTLAAAWDSGVRYFDTAPHDGSGLSEHRFGATQRERDPSNYVLSTKVGRLFRPRAARGRTNVRLPERHARDGRETRPHRRGLWA